MTLLKNRMCLVDSAIHGCCFVGSPHPIQARTNEVSHHFTITRLGRQTLQFQSGATGQTLDISHKYTFSLGKFLMQPWLITKLKVSKLLNYTLTWVYDMKVLEQQLFKSFQIVSFSCVNLKVWLHKATPILISRAPLRYSTLWPNLRLPKTFWSTKKTSAFIISSESRKKRTSIHLANIHSWKLTYHIPKKTSWLEDYHVVPLKNGSLGHLTGILHSRFLRIRSVQVHPWHLMPSTSTCRVEGWRSLIKSYPTQGNGLGTVEIPVKIVAFFEVGKMGSFRNLFHIGWDMFLLLPSRDIQIYIWSSLYDHWIIILWHLSRVFFHISMNIVLLGTLL